MNIRDAKLLHGLYLIHHHENFKLTNQKPSYYGVFNSKMSKPIILIAWEHTICIFSIIYGKCLLSHNFFNSSVVKIFKKTNRWTIYQVTCLV